MKVFIVSGEASGDRLGAALVGGLKQSIPDISIQGVAGPEMKALGVPSLFEMSELSVMGVSEIFSKYANDVRSVFREVSFKSKKYLLSNICKE